LLHDDLFLGQLKYKNQSVVLSALSATLLKDSKTALYEILFSRFPNSISKPVSWLLCLSEDKGSKIFLISQPF